MAKGFGLKRPPYVDLSNFYIILRCKTWRSKNKEIQPNGQTTPQMINNGFQTYFLVLFYFVLNIFFFELIFLE